MVHLGRAPMSLGNELDCADLNPKHTVAPAVCSVCGAQELEEIALLEPRKWEREGRGRREGGGTWTQPPRSCGKCALGKQARAGGCPSGRLRGHPALFHLLFLSRALLWAPGNTYIPEQAQGLSLPKPNAFFGGSSSCFSFGNHPLFTPVGPGADTVPGLQDGCESQVWLVKNHQGKVGAVHITSVARQQLSWDFGGPWDADAPLHLGLGCWPGGLQHCSLEASPWREHLVQPRQRRATLRAGRWLPPAAL